MWYECHICESKFMNKNCLFTHIVIIHNGVRYVCQQGVSKLNDRNNQHGHVQNFHDV